MKSQVKQLKQKSRSSTPTADPRGSLATPTSLKSQDVSEIARAVNALVADSFALYVKNKNFHWHLSGPHFRDYHLLLDEQAAEILDSIDILAERVRRIGGTTIRSIGHLAQLKTIEDDNEDYVPPREMIERLLADNRQMADAQRVAIEMCDEKKDTPTGNVLQEVLDQTEKRIWFLFETLQGTGQHSPAAES